MITVRFIQEEKKMMTVEETARLHRVAAALQRILLPTAARDRRDALKALASIATDAQAALAELMKLTPWRDAWVVRDLSVTGGTPRGPTWLRQRYAVGPRHETIAVVPDRAQAERLCDRANSARVLRDALYAVLALTSGQPRDIALGAIERFDRLNGGAAQRAEQAAEQAAQAEAILRRQAAALKPKARRRR